MIEIAAPRRTARAMFGHGHHQAAVRSAAAVLMA
jgi:hypothetical protein